MSKLRMVLVVAAAALVLSGCDGTVGGPGSTTGTGAATVPTVTGKRLNDAERQLRAAGFSKLRPVDASPAGRVVLDPNNWVVQSQSPAGGAHADRSAAVTLKVAKPTDQASGGPVTKGTIPNVVCKDLQSAQNTLQSAGFFNLGSADGSGQGRVQVLDRNWVVIKQSVPAGERPSRRTRIVLTAVKYGEPTGTSGCPS